MKLFSKVTIERFRSIRDTTLEDVGEYSVLAGLNNSGKSNFLRALHLFFEGAPEPGVSFDLDRDYYRPEVRSKKKKTIEIEVAFVLPDRFHFRKGLEPVQTLLGREFSLRKRWERGRPDPLIFLNGTELTVEDSYKAEQFLNLTTFRYIPNRVVPTDVINDNEEALRDILIRRLAKYRKQTEQVLGAIRQTAQTVIADVSSQLGQMMPDVSQVRLDTASSLAELAFRFGYRLTEGEVETDESEQGSGIQSLLMFQTLHLIDRDFFQQFGWKQAAIWGVEEPESSLHTALEAQVAQFISTIARDPSGRLQAMATTHSDMMVQYADKGYLIEKAEPSPRVPWRRSVATSLAPRDLLSHTARSGISRWVNPILYFHVEPLILVEGISDQDFITQGLRLQTGKEYRVASLASLLDDPSQGGIETLKRFIRENAGAIQSRPTTAQVVLILDWDARGKVPQFEQLLDGSDPYQVMAWDEREANPKLDSTFKGIERFLSDRIIGEVEKLDENLVATRNDGTRTISAEYGRFKKIAATIVEQGLTQEDLVFAKEFLTTIAEVARSG